MQRRYSAKITRTPYKRVGSQGFPDGMNTIGHPLSIKNSELSDVMNGIYSQYGTIAKRPGSLIRGSALANSTYIVNMGQILGFNSKDYLLRISDIGKPEYLDEATDTWKLFTGTAPVGYTGTNPVFTAGTPTFDITTPTYIVQAGIYVFFANAVNELIYWDGTKWYIYAVLADPAAAPTLAKGGSGTGTTNWYYAYCDLNEVGSTVVSPISLALANMPPVLTDTTYIEVTMAAAPAGTLKRAIYRGITNSLNDLKYLDKVDASQTVYTDKGSAIPSLVFSPITANTTRGYHFTNLDVYHDTLVGVSVEMGKDTVVYSAGGDKITSFGVPDGAGYIEWRKGQGKGINQIKSFAASNEDGVYVFKWNKIGKFKFDTTGALITDVNVSIGSPAPNSVHMAGNNMRFWSDEGASSLGNEANFGTILRYSVMSLKADTYVQQVNRMNVQDICADYYKHISLFAIPMGSDVVGNNAVLAFDERYNAWSIWTGLNINYFQKFIDIRNVEKLFAGCSNSGNVLEMFNGKTDNRLGTGSGNKINLSITTKQYGDKIIEQKNRFNKIVIIFGTLSGNATTVLVQEDGVYNQNPFKIPVTTQSGVGFGSDMWGETIFGESDEITTVIPNINFRYLNLQNKLLRNIKLNITNNGTQDEIELIGIFAYYKPTTIGPDYTEQITENAVTV